MPRLERCENGFYVSQRPAARTRTKPSIGIVELCLRQSAYIRKASVLTARHASSVRANLVKSVSRVGWGEAPVAAPINVANESLISWQPAAQSRAVVHRGAIGERAQVEFRMCAPYAPRDGTSVALCSCLGRMLMRRTGLSEIVEPCARALLMCDPPARISAA